jgi:transcription initiation factor IIE alpha subunit
MDERVLDEVYFSVDGEFDGPYPPAHSTLAIGVVEFTLNRGILDAKNPSFLHACLW